MQFNRNDKEPKSKIKKKITKDIYDLVMAGPKLPSASLIGTFASVNQLPASSRTKLRSVQCCVSKHILYASLIMQRGTISECACRLRLCALCCRFRPARICRRVRKCQGALSKTLLRNCGGFSNSK